MTKWNTDFHTISCIYESFLQKNSIFPSIQEFTNSSQHTISIHQRYTTNSECITNLKLICPHFKIHGIKHQFLSSFIYTTQIHPYIYTAIRLTSQQQVDLKMHYLYTTNMKFTLEAREQTGKVTFPISYAKIGWDYIHPDFYIQTKANEYRKEKLRNWIKIPIFAGMKIDAVNGPTIQMTGGLAKNNIAIAGLAAYDMGYDCSDRLGRVRKLDMALRYHKDDLHALLHLYAKGRQAQVSIAQEISSKLMIGYQFHYDAWKDARLITFQWRYKVDTQDEKQTIGSISSNGILTTAYEWQCSKNISTRISAQMDVCNYDRDSHRLGVAIILS